MTTRYDSFDESPLGGFIESPLGARGDGRELDLISCHATEFALTYTVELFGDPYVEPAVFQFDPLVAEMFNRRPLVHNPTLSAAGRWESAGSATQICYWTSQPVTDVDLANLPMTPLNNFGQTQHWVGPTVAQLSIVSLPAGNTNVRLKIARATSTQFQTNGAPVSWRRCLDFADVGNDGILRWFSGRWPRTDPLPAKCVSCLEADAPANTLTDCQYLGNPYLGYFGWGNILKCSYGGNHPNNHGAFKSIAT